MDKVFEAGKMLKALDFLYEKALTGVAGFDRAEDLANNYLRKHSDKIKAANSLVNNQVKKCAASGFLTSFGGLITLPVTLPINITSVLYVQIRMIAAIACMGGFDINDDQVKTYVYMVLAGQSIADTLKDVGIKITTKSAGKVLKNIPGAILIKINKQIGYRLITKAGDTGIINLTKFVPVLGGVVSGAFDGTTTKLIGNRAIKTFLE